MCCPDCTGTASSGHCSADFTGTHQLVASSYTATVVALSLLCIRARAVTTGRPRGVIARPTGYSPAVNGGMTTPVETGGSFFF